MIIRKLFKFENAHIVRGCSSVKCRESIHGHSYKVELLFESNFLDNGQMVYDFGLMKQNMKALVESFDHAIAFWSGDSSEYLKDMKKHSDRWVELPVSPSA
ncbi:MAG: 6-carboxytetrahydropterin synthase, partial [Campylobacterota bacterium]|nr:6-carboxytetrahydropterin synthase [Campylobacterota bacterium]